MDVTFIQAETEEEGVLLASLASEIWNECYSRIISKEQIDYMLAKFQSIEAITDQWNNQGYEYYRMNTNGRDIGYVAIKQDNAKLFLSKFYIAKEHRGNGFASRAMEFLVRICQERKLTAIWLTVNRHNDAAIAIYERKGFRAVRTQVADIGNGYVMDDYIMEKAIELETIR